MSTGRELLAAACLLVQAATSAGVAVLLCRRVSTDRLERALVATALFFVQAVGISIVLAMVGAFSLPTVLVAHGVVLAAVLAHERRSTTARPAPMDPRAGWSPWGLAALGGGVTLLVLSTVVTIQGPITNDFDTREYHITNMAHWLQDGDMWTLPYAGPGSITATHPGNGELFSAWMSLPTHGDEIAYLGPTAFGLLAVLGAAVVARQLGGRVHASAGAMSAVAVLAAPIYFVTQTKSLSSDLPSAAPLVAGLAFVLLARARPTAPLVLLAGASFGMGLGGKYTALAPGAVAVVLSLVLLARRWWAWLVPGLALFGLPWFLRNLLETGNPLFPLDLPGFEGGETPIDILDQSMLDHFLHREGEIIERWARLVARFIGPILVLIIPGVVLAWRRIDDKRAALCCTVLAVLAVGGQIALPYTGGGAEGLDFLIASCFRYGLAAVLFGAAVAAAALPPRWSAPLAAACAVWGLQRAEAGAVTNTQPIELKEIGGSVAVGAAVAGVIWFLSGEEERWRRAPRWLRRNLVAGAAAAVVLGAFGGAFVVFHKEDRGRRLLPLEVVLQPFGWDRPALVMGAEDMRAVLGPRLERPVAKVARGGHADEVPFVTVDQIRREVLGEDAPPEPPELAEELTRAVDDSGYDLLVVGHGTPIAVPEGWEPSDRWCEVGRDKEMIVYATRTVLGLGADTACPAP